MPGVQNTVLVPCPRGVTEHSHCPALGNMEPGPTRPAGPLGPGKNVCLRVSHRPRQGSYCEGSRTGPEQKGFHPGEMQPLTPEGKGRGFSPGIPKKAASVTE